MNDRLDDRLDDVLDDLFGRLAPLGAAGRRAYAEAEAHLIQSTEEQRRAGASPDQAQQNALERFGAVDDYVRGMGAATRLPARAVLARLLADAWLLGGISAFFVGLAGVALSVVRAVAGAAWIAGDLPGTVLSPARCAQLKEYYYPNATGCLEASRLHHADEIVFAYLACGAVGLAALTAYRLARRGRLRALTRLSALAQPGLVAIVGTVGAAAVSVLQLLQGTSDLALGIHNGVATTLCLAAAAGSAAVILAPRALAAIRT